MLSIEEQRSMVEEILGTPLPELDPIYYEGAKLYAATAPNTFITPYLLHELYTPSEMKLVLQLPGTGEEVAEKLGLNPIEVEATLNRLYRFGRLLPMKKGKPGYAPSVDMVTIRDQIGMAYISMGLDWSPKLPMFRLMEAWRTMRNMPPQVVEALSSGFRVIPKYESIKNLPGVMYCENIKEIMDSFQEVDKLAIQQCVCKVYNSYVQTGSYSPDHCQCGLHEHDATDGHCMALGTRADFVAENYGAHFPTREETDRCLWEIDASTAVLSAPNKRQLDFVCSCCDDCCAIAGYEHDGIPIRVPSRFRPKVREDRCVGCGLCVERCVFHAVKVENGKASINPDQCMGCGNCVVTCPQKALKMTIVHDVDWIPDLWEDDDNWNIPAENTKDYLEQQKKK